MSRRIRTIKPELLDDEKTASISDGAARLFQGAILLADDYGNLRGDARWLRGQIWWARSEVTDQCVASLLGELVSMGLVSMYSAGDQSYLSVCGWEKHQRIDNAGKPRVPGPVHDNSDSRGISPRTSANLRDSRLDPDPDPDHIPAEEKTNETSWAGESGPNVPESISEPQRPPVSVSRDGSLSVVVSAKQNDPDESSPAKTTLADIVDAGSALGEIPPVLIPKLRRWIECGLYVGLAREAISAVTRMDPGKRNWHYVAGILKSKLSGPDGQIRPLGKHEYRDEHGKIQPMPVYWYADVNADQTNLQNSEA